MSEAIKATIAELQNQIRTWEQEIGDTKKVINSLAMRAGMSPVYADAELMSKASINSMRRDQFYGKTLTTALRELLSMRKVGGQGPATVNELFDGLLQGGFDHGSANDDNARRVIRITLTKNSGIFHRLPDDKTFGLTEWYPAIRNRKPKEEEPEVEGEAAAGSAPTKAERTKPEGDQPQKESAQ